jgi:beta-lactamase class A
MVKSCTVFKALSILSLSLLISCSGTKNIKVKSIMEKTRSEIISLIQSSTGTFAVAYKDLQTGEMILINENENFHAASTMKTPVMIEVFKQAREKKFSLDDSIPVKNEFKSIVDNSSYSLRIDDDSDGDLYKLLGQKNSIYDLVYRMIIKSSNLSTNLLIEKVGAKNVINTMRSIGAQKIQVLRGVEDDKAYDAGMNNTTTAFDLMLVFEAISKNSILPKEDCQKMINILFDQSFNDKIPALLPKNVKVAHKTGSITGVQHDSGIVFLPDGRKYVLVTLSKDLKDKDAGIKTLAQISKIIYQNIYANI